jgi:hypothetical protein
MQSRRLDIRPYLMMLDGRLKEQVEPLLKIQTKEYIDFIKSFTDEVNIMTKTFFIVIPYSSNVIKSGNKIAASAIRRGGGIKDTKVPTILITKELLDKGKGIKEISKEIEDLQKITPVVTGYYLTKSKDKNVLKLEVLRQILSQYKRNFNIGECTDTLEQNKAEENAKILTKESAKSEKQVLEKIQLNF